jgi:hypothetical protein
MAMGKPCGQASSGFSEARFFPQRPNPIFREDAIPCLGEGTQRPHSRVIPEIASDEGDRSMNRVTVLAGAAAAVILLGLTVLNAAPNQGGELPSAVPTTVDHAVFTQ